MGEIEYIARSLADADSLNWNGLGEQGKKRYMRLAAEAVCAVDRYRRCKVLPGIVHETD